MVNRRWHLGHRKEGVQLCWDWQALPRQPFWTPGPWAVGCGLRGGCGLGAPIWL